MALILTQCRWRSRLFALIVIFRRAAAYILARDMVIVSRWIMSEMNTSDAPSRLQGQKQQQDQDAHPNSEQAQSEACLAQACVNETYQGTRSCQNTAQGKQRCRTLRSTPGPLRSGYRRRRSDATTENDTEALPRRQWTLSDGANRRRRLLVSRMANDEAANGMNL